MAPFTLTLFFLLFATAHAGNLVAITRGGASDDSVTGDTNTCNFTGTVELANPMSLDPTDKFFKTGASCRSCAALVVRS